MSPTTAADHFSAERSLFFAGKMLTAADLGRDQRYGNERRRLLTRALFGWGIVHGLVVEVPERQRGHVRVTAGLALDPYGREIFLRHEELLSYACLWRETGCEEKSYHLLAAHYAEHRVDPAYADDGCGCKPRRFNRVHEEVVFSLVPADLPNVDPCALVPKHHPANGEDKRRSLHAFVCRSLERLEDAAQIGATSDLTCEWHGRRFDRCAGVPLAILEIGGDEHCPTVEVVETCPVRRFVYRNPLLFDLIAAQQESLTRIVWLSWQDWHMRLDPPVPYPEFRDAFIQGEARGIKIRFSRPVRKACLNEAAFVVTMVFPERAVQVEEVRRLRLRVKPVPAEDDPPDCASGVRIRLSRGWVRDELVDIRSYLNDGALFELEVRGDLILDECGRALDAEPIDFPHVPTGNGVPGGTFLFVFRVGQRNPSSSTSYSTTQTDNAASERP